MTRPFLRAAIASSLALSLVACATKPKPSLPTVASNEQPSPSADNASPGLEGRSMRPGSQEDLVAAAGDRVYFGFDSYDLDGSARASLSQQAAWLGRHPEVPVVVAGNADERGTREYNLALGARRAAAAREALVAAGVASTRIETVSYGKERPLDARSSDDAWAKNRNAQTIVKDAVGRGW